MPDLTLAKKALFDALRTVHFGEDAEAQLIRYNPNALNEFIGDVMQDGWNASRSELVSGKNTLFFDYADEDDLRKTDLKKATGVIIRLSPDVSGIIYKFGDKDAPITLTKNWGIVLIPTGEREQ